MLPRQDSEADELLRRQARTLHWGLMLYLVVLLLIGIGVLRLALTARQFDRLTVNPVEAPAADSGAGPDDSADGTVLPVSGAVP